MKTCCTAPLVEKNHTDPPDGVHTAQKQLARQFSLLLLMLTTHDMKLAGCIARRCITKLFTSFHRCTKQYCWDSCCRACVLKLQPRLDTSSDCRAISAVHHVERVLVHALPWQTFSAFLEAWCLLPKQFLAPSMGGRFSGTDCQSPSSQKWGS